MAGRWRAAALVFVVLGLAGACARGAAATPGGGPSGSSSNTVPAPSSAQSADRPIVTLLDRSGESGEVTQILLIALAGVFLFLVPTQLAKGVVARRRAKPELQPLPPADP
jgi:hypothetical protein